MSINETVLEMHFHRSLLELFRDTVGLGNGNFNFYKYSPQRECFIGFDQAFVQTDLKEDDLFEQLQSDALKNGYKLSNFFVGYFLQYKVVKPMANRSRHTPTVIKSKPHYRVSLDTRKNDKTGLSQHELLYSLSKNIDAMVYYACPMIFDRSELYNLNPNLDDLRLVDLKSCPSIYNDNESHYIYYDNPNSDPIWCSEPIKGEAITPQYLFKKIVKNIEDKNFYANQLKLLDSLIKPTEIAGLNGRILDFSADSLVIMKYTLSKPNFLSRSMIAF